MPRRGHDGRGIQSPVHEETPLSDNHQQGYVHHGHEEDGEQDYEDSVEYLTPLDVGLQQM